MVKKLILFIWMFVLVGCGGGGGGGSSVPSPFSGQWVGTYSGAAGNGTANITVANNGNLAGTITDNALPGQTGSIIGDINSGGTVEGAYQYPGFDVLSFEGTWALSNGGTTLSGAVLIEESVTANFTLTKQ